MSTRNALQVLELICLVRRNQQAYTTAEIRRSNKKHEDPPQPHGPWYRLFHARGGSPASVRHLSLNPVGGYQHYAKSETGGHVDCSRCRAHLDPRAGRPLEDRLLEATSVGVG